jgi:hypothetical protein
MDEPVVRSRHGCSPETGHQLDVPGPPAVSATHSVPPVLSGVCDVRTQSGPIVSVAFVRGDRLRLGHGRAPLARGAEEQPPSAFIDSLATVRLAFGGAGLAGARVPSGFAAAGFIRFANASWQFAKALTEHAANAKADLLVVTSGPAPGPCAPDSRDHVE